MKRPEFTPMDLEDPAKKDCDCGCEDCPVCTNCIFCKNTRTCPGTLGKYDCPMCGLQLEDPH